MGCEVLLADVTSHDRAALGDLDQLQSKMTWEKWFSGLDKHVGEGLKTTRQRLFNHRRPTITDPFPSLARLPTNI